MNKNFLKKKQLQQQLNRFYSSSMPCKELTNIIGISRLDFEKFIEIHFIEEMNKQNYGEIWQLDHVIPIHLFDLSDINSINLCFNYMNIIPLYKRDNKLKGASVYFSLKILEKRLKVYPDNNELKKLIDLCRLEINNRWEKYI